MGRRDRAGAKLLGGGQPTQLPPAPQHQQPLHKSKNHSHSGRKQTHNPTETQLDDRRRDINIRLSQQKQQHLALKLKLEQLQLEQQQRKESEERLLIQQRRLFLEAETIYSRLHNVESTLHLLSLVNFDTVLHDVLRLINGSIYIAPIAGMGGSTHSTAASDLFGDFDNDNANESLLRELKAKHELFTTGVPLYIAEQYRIAFGLFGIELRVELVEQRSLLSLLPLHSNDMTNNNNNINNTSNSEKNNNRVRLLSCDDFIPLDEPSSSSPLHPPSPILPHLPDIDDQSQLTTQRITPYSIVQYTTGQTHAKITNDNSNNNAIQFAILTKLPTTLSLQPGTNKDLKRSNLLVQRFKQFGTENNDTIDLKQFFAHIHSLHLTKFESELTPALIDTCFGFRDTGGSTSNGIIGSIVNNTVALPPPTPNTSKVSHHSKPQTVHTQTLSVGATNTNPITNYIPQTTSGLLLTSDEYQAYYKFLREGQQRQSQASQPGVLGGGFNNGSRTDGPNIFLASIPSLPELNQVALLTQIHQSVLPSAPLGCFLLASSYRALATQLLPPHEKDAGPKGVGGGNDHPPDETEAAQHSDDSALVDGPQPYSTFFLDTIPSIYRLPHSFRLPTDPSLFNLHHGVGYTLNLTNRVTAQQPQLSRIATLIATNTPTTAAPPTSHSSPSPNNRFSHDHTLDFGSPNANDNDLSITTTTSTNNGNGSNTNTVHFQFQPSTEVLQRAKNFLSSLPHANSLLVQFSKLKQRSTGPGAAGNQPTPNSASHTLLLAHFNTQQQQQQQTQANLNHRHHLQTYKFHNSHILPKLNTVNQDTSSIKIAQCVALLTYLNMHSNGRSQQFINKQVNSHLNPIIIEPLINSLVVVLAQPVIVSNLLYSGASATASSSSSLFSTTATNTSNNNPNSKGLGDNTSGNTSTTTNSNLGSTSTAPNSLAATPVEYKVEVDYSGFAALEHKILFLTELYNSGLYTDSESYFGIISTIFKMLFRYLEGYAKRTALILNRDGSHKSNSTTTTTPSTSTSSNTNPALKYLHFHHFHTTASVVPNNTYLVSRFEYNISVLAVFRLLNVWFGRVPEISRLQHGRMASKLWDYYSKYSYIPPTLPPITHPSSSSSSSSTTTTITTTTLNSIIQYPLTTPEEKLIALKQYEHKLYLDSLPQLIWTANADLVSASSPTSPPTTTDGKHSFSNDFFWFV